MLVYAHRAGRGLAPENTFFASQTALQYPIDFIDFDLGMTQDEELVVTHDPFLNPTITRDQTGRYLQKPISLLELTYSDLKTFNVGQIDPHAPYARYFPDQISRPFESIPLLKEIIEFVKHASGKKVRLQLEIKTYPAHPELTLPSELFAKKLAALLKATEMLEFTEVQSFDFKALMQIQEENSQIKTSYLTFPLSDDVSLRAIKDLGGSCWGPFQGDLTQEKVYEAQTLGLKVVPWGFPEIEGSEFNLPVIQKLIEWQVDGIITDRPDKLLSLSINS